MFLQAEQEVRTSLLSESSSLLETLLADERTRLVRFCAHLTGNPDAAEDLTQETLLEAWRNQQKLHGQDVRQNKETWIKWLRAIARHVCMRWARSHSRDLAHLAPFNQDEDETEWDIEDLAANDYDVEIEL